MKLNVIRNMVICVAASLLFVPLVYAQDLSKYRNFSLGSSLTELLVQVSAQPADATVVHPAPALIQQLTWWPVKSHQTTAPTDAVQEVEFSLFNGALYKIVVTYENSATEGLSVEDMVDAISVNYGAATMPVADKDPPPSAGYSSSRKTIAVWEDAQYSVTLSRFPLSSVFQLVMLSKQWNGQADMAIAEAVNQERENAPQKKLEREKQEAADLETMRQANLKAFRP
jgi:hypothetical protein